MKLLNISKAGLVFSALALVTQAYAGVPVGDVATGTATVTVWDSVTATVSITPVEGLKAGNNNNMGDRVASFSATANSNHPNNTVAVRWTPGTGDIGWLGNEALYSVTSQTGKYLTVAFEGYEANPVGSDGWMVSGGKTLSSNIVLPSTQDVPAGVYPISIDATVYSN